MTTKISEMTPSPIGLTDDDWFEIARSPFGPGTTFRIQGPDVIDYVLGGGSLSGTNTGDQNLFATIAVSGQSNVVADSTTDTLTLVAGTGITITTNATTDAITITNSGAASDSFKTIAVSGQSNVVADSGTDTLTLIAGTNVTITTNATTDEITINATGSGTVTHTGGALTANAVVLGAGSADTKVVAGIITDGTSILELGVAGASVGKVTLHNATSGSITFQPTTGALGTVTLTAPATTGTLALLSDLTSGYQPLDSDLTTIAGLTATTDSFIQSKSSAWASRTVAQVAADLSPSIKATESVVIACSDESTALTAGTAKVTFRMPYAFTVTAVRASLTTAQASGSIFTVDINEAGTSIISTKITIDNTEKTSTTAATPPVISDSSLADDAEMTIDIDQIGNGTATGLKVYLIGSRT